jgi:intracellular septation protein A
MHNFENPEPEETSLHTFGGNERRLFSRDFNYLRDMALFWPFIFYSIFGVASAFSPGYRYLAIRCAVVAIAALILAKEKLFLFIVGVGFVAVQCVITLILHSWNSAVLTAGVLTGCTFLLAGHFWRKRKLTYKLPNEFRLVDALWSIASILCSLLLAYVVSPFK